MKWTWIKAVPNISSEHFTTEFHLIELIYWSYFFYFLFHLKVSCCDLEQESLISHCLSPPRSVLCCKPLDVWSSLAKVWFYHTGLIFRDRKLSFCNKWKHKLVPGRERIYNARMNVGLRKIFSLNSPLTLTSSSLVQPGRSDLSSTIRSPPPSLKRSCLGASIASPLYFFTSWLCTSWKATEMSLLV